MNKLFAFDMDGTILNSKGQLVPETIKALKEGKEKGHHFIIATGRPYKDAMRDTHAISEYLDYIVCNNGTYYGKPDGSEFKYLGNVAHKFIDIAIELGREHKAFFAIHGSQEAQRGVLADMNDIDWDSEEFEEFKKFKDTFLGIEEMKEWAKNQSVSQISLRSDKKTIKNLEGFFDKYKDEADIHIANDVYLDINPIGISKIVGVDAVAKHLGYKLDEVVAFGDSGNDLQMLKGVGLGICMGNGNEFAKEAADIVIDSNDTNAIADKIRELI